MQARPLPALEEGWPVLDNEVGCVVLIAGEGRVANGVGDQAVLQQPRRGSTVQIGTIDRGGPGELEPEELAEELVALLPGTGVERYEEVIRALNLHQALTRSGRSGDRVTQRAGEALEDRRANPEGPHVVGVEHLGAEVVDEGLVTFVVGIGVEARRRAASAGPTVDGDDSWILARCPPAAGARVSAGDDKGSPG